MLIKYSLKYFLIVAIPSVFALSILSKPILILLTTPEIASHGYLITPFITISALLAGIFGIITNYLILQKKTKIIGSIWLITAVLTVLNIIFIPYFGIIGAAIVTVISYTLAFILGLFFTRKDFKMKFDYFFILKSLTASILMSIFIILANPQGLLNVIIIMINNNCVSAILLLKGINHAGSRLFKKYDK